MTKQTTTTTKTTPTNSLFTPVASRPGWHTKNKLEEELLAARIAQAPDTDETDRVIDLIASRLFSEDPAAPYGMRRLSGAELRAECDSLEQLTAIGIELGIIPAADEDVQAGQAD